MSNIQYHDIIKSKLSQAGYPSSLLDSLTNQIIRIAENYGVNALTLLEELNRKKVDLKSSKLLNNVAPQNSKGTYFTTFRHSEPKTSKLLSRQIIIR